MLQQFKKRISFNLWLLLPIIVFTFLFLPFIDTPVCWDAGAEYDMTNTFYTRGIREFSLITIAHPPFKPILVSSFYKVFGNSTRTYNLVGLAAGYMGIIAIYLLTKYLYNKNAALFSSLLLSTFPLFLANSVNGLNDFILTGLIILAIYFYSQKKIFLYILSASAAVLTKETAALLPACVLFVELIFAFRGKEKNIMNLFIRFLLLCSPLFLLFLWNKYTFFNGRSSAWWNAPEGAYVAILKNLITLNIFTTYTKEHISKLLFFNFNWVYWLILITGSILFIRSIRKIAIKLFFFQQKQKNKTIFVIILLFISYIFSVLTFQVPPTARYHLVIIPYMLIGVSIILCRYLKRIPFILLLSFGIFSFFSLFFSVDPITSGIWNKQYLEGQNVYTKSTGDDGLVYNLQYLFILKQRRNQILSQYHKTTESQLNWYHPFLYTKHCNFRS